jgi:hypothetical protein
MAEHVSEKLDELRDEFRSDIKAAQAHPGVLPPIKPWEPETVAYAGSLVSHDSALWQAITDTAQRPSPEASQWSLIVCSESASVNRRIRAISRTSRDEIAVLRNELEAAKCEINSVTDALDEAIATERGEQRKESLEEVRRSFAAELSSMEERAKQREDARRAAVDQRVERSVDVTRKLMADAINEAIATERGERRKEFTASFEEMRRSLAAELAALEEREKQRGNASRAAVDQRIEQYNFTHKLATDAIREGLVTERNDRGEEVAKEVGELRNALKALGEAISAERAARHDELAKAISSLRSELEAMDKAIAADRRAQRDEIVQLRQEISQLRAETEATFAAHEARETQRETAGNAWRAAIEQRIDSVGEAIATERAEQRQEFTTAFEEMRGSFDTKLATLEERLKGVPGRLPPVKIWHPETVVYEGEIAAHEGSLYQARKDSAQVPGGPDWLLIASAGRDGVDGVDGRSLNIRGVYDVKAKYAKLDVVLFGGEPFLATRDDPGLCPDDGWMLLAPRGKAGDTGPAGPRGAKGDKGETGAMIRSWLVDCERYRASPLMSDGTVGPMLELRGLFELYQIQTSQ